MYNMKIEEFKALIGKAEYKPVDLSKFRTCSTFEGMNSFGQNQFLFDDLLEQLGRVPTHMEFLRSHEKTISDFFLNSPKSTLAWNRELAEGVAARMGRMYTSQLVEYSTVLRIKELFPGYVVGVNKYLDNVGGVDIVVGDPVTNKVVYIHIIANSWGAKDRLEEKRTKAGRLILNGASKFFNRKQVRSNHIALMYQYYADETTEYVNGLPLLKEEYVRQTVLKGLECSSETLEEPKELNKFNDWLKEVGIKEGLSELAV